jgi:tRNA(Ile)-lysidine synthase
LRRLEPIVRTALRGDCRLPRGSAILVAVSGGADSTALLQTLRNVAREFGLDLHVAHLDHGLRGAESRADRSFVQALCARLGVPFTSARWNTPLRMRRLGISGERGLRVLRRAYLESVARRIGAAAIATAHTADDQLETVLMRLGRGTGLAGRGGIRPRAGIWLRPLLEASRREIEEDLRRAGQVWREDSSNRDLRYTRNRIRHQVVPALVAALPGTSEPSRSHALLARRVSRTALEVRDAGRAMERAASRLLDTEGRFGRAGLSLSVRALAELSPARSSAVFRLAWKRLHGGDTGLTHRHLQSLHRIVRTSRSGASIDLPEGWRAMRERDVLRMERSFEPARTPTFLFGLPGELSCGNRIVRGGWVSGRSARGRLALKPATEEFFAAEGLDGDLELRAAQADETFVPFGGRRPVRIREFLSKQRVSREVRTRPTVLADAGGILWVVGVRRSARAPVTSGTRRVLRVFAENHD